MIKKLLFTFFVCFHMGTFAQITPPVGATEKDIYYDSNNNAWAVYTTLQKVYPYLEIPDYYDEYHKVNIKKRVDNKWVYINNYIINSTVEKEFVELLKDTYGQHEYIDVTYDNPIKVFFDSQDNLLFTFNLKYYYFEAVFEVDCLYGFINGKIHLLDGEVKSYGCAFGCSNDWFNTDYYFSDGRLYYDVMSCWDECYKLKTVEVLPYYKLVTMATPVVTNGKDLLLVFKNGKFVLEGKEDATLIVNNVNGQTILNEDLNAGFYFVTIVSKDGSTTRVKAIAQ